MGAPGNGLDGSLMLAPLEGWCVVELVPNHQLVVVASASKLTIVAVPLQATDLLAMTSEPANILIRSSDIAMEDDAIPRSRSEDVLVPGKGTNTACVTSHGTQAALRLSIPDLNEAAVGTDGNVRSLKTN